MKKKLYKFNCQTTCAETMTFSFALFLFLQGTKAALQPIHRICMLGKKGEEDCGHSSAAEVKDSQTHSDRETLLVSLSEQS